MIDDPLSLTPEEAQAQERARQFAKDWCQRPRSQKELALTAGLKETTLSAFLTCKNGLTSGNYLLLCKALDLDPQTGEPKPKRTIRVHVVRGKNRKMYAVNQPPEVIFTEADYETIPDDLEMLEDEVAAVLKARSLSGDALVRQAQILINVSDLNQAVKDAIFATLDGKYSRAIELLARMAQNGGAKG